MVIASWKEKLNSNKVIVAVFLDLKRAFETIDRSILFQKLQRYGISEKAMEWIRSFLSNRKQRTRVTTVLSGDREVPLGLPQGSCIAPLLFILYINDIEDAIENGNIKLFADDAMLMVCENTLEQAVEKMNKNLDSLYKWLCANKLKLNIGKTEAMIIGSKISDQTAHI